MAPLCPKNKLLIKKNDTNDIKNTKLGSINETKIQLIGR